jgi:hypothetical protein
MLFNMLMFEDVSVAFYDVSRTLQGKGHRNSENDCPKAPAALLPKLK